MKTNYMYMLCAILPALEFTHRLVSFVYQAAFAGGGAGKYVSHLRAMNLPSLREGGAASVSSARASFPPAEEMEENVVAFGAEGASSNNLEKGVTIVTSPPPGDIAIDGNYDMSERGLAPAKSNAAEKNGLFWKASLDARGGACCADSIESKTEQLLGIVGLRGERWWGEVWGSGWARDRAGCRDAGDARVVGRGGKIWTREAGKDVECAESRDGGMLQSLLRLPIRILSRVLHAQLRDLRHHAGDLPWKVGERRMRGVGSGGDGLDRGGEQYSTRVQDHEEVLSVSSAEGRQRFGKILELLELASEVRGALQPFVDSAALWSLYLSPPPCPLLADGVVGDGEESCDDATMLKSSVVHVNVLSQLAELCLVHGKFALIVANLRRINVSAVWGSAEWAIACDSLCDAALSLRFDKKFVRLLSEVRTLFRARGGDTLEVCVLHGVLGEDEVMLPQEKELQVQSGGDADEEEEAMAMRMCLLLQDLALYSLSLLSHARAALMDRTEQPKEEGSTSEGRGNTEGTRGWDESGTREGLNQAVATCERVISCSKDVLQLFGLSVEYTVPTSANNGATFLEALKVAGYIRLRPAPSRARRLNRMDGDVDWGDEIERDEGDEGAAVIVLASMSMVNHDDVRCAERVREMLGLSFSSDVTWQDGERPQGHVIRIWLRSRTNAEIQIGGGGGRGGREGGLQS